MTYTYLCADGELAAVREGRKCEELPLVFSSNSHLTFHRKWSTMKEGYGEGSFMNEKEME